MSSRSRRHGNGSRSEAPESPGPSRILGALPIILGAAVVVAAGLWFGGFFRSSSGDERGAASPAASSQSATNQLPAFVSAASARVREAYAFAATHGAELAYIPCYCGCGEHSGHRNVRDCFVKQATTSGVVYDPHGSTCDICVSIVLDVKKVTGEGQSLAAARKYVDETYAKVGPGTDTPLPPGMEAVQ